MAGGGANAFRGPAILAKRSEYLLQLSSEARARLEAKISSVGLNVDPYAIDSDKWSRNPEVLPKVKWSDVLLYMISTPSPYMKEAIKVDKLMLLHGSYLPQSSIFTGLERNVRFGGIFKSRLGT